MSFYVQPPLFGALRAFAEDCERGGLDLVWPFSLEPYNASVNPREQLPNFGRNQTQALLIGNTRALWPTFLRAIAQDPHLARTEHPLDDYVVHQVESARVHVPYATHLEFSHVVRPRALPFQRLAELAGFARRSPSQLNVHPEYGPWFALRAVLVLDCDAAPSTHTAPDLCSACTKPCVPAFEHALAAAKHAQRSLGLAVVHDAANWIGIRDACPYGRDYRYSEDQLRYHYAKDRAALGLP